MLNKFCAALKEFRARPPHGAMLGGQVMTCANEMLPLPRLIFPFAWRLVFTVWRHKSQMPCPFGSKESY
jgi:hypothetical protein